MTAEARHEVVVVGETLMDVVHSSTGTAERPGGSPMNVAIGLARLGHRVGLLTSIGDDARGAVLRAHVERDGVELLEGSVIAAPSSTSAATLAADGSASYEFSIRWDLATAPTPAPAAILHTGSIASFLEPGASRVTELLRTAAGRALVSLDPNIRPSLIAAEARDTVLTRLAASIALATVVKLSDEDAEWLYPGASADDVLDRLLAAGPTLAIMTRGGTDSLLSTRADRVRCLSDTVEVVDTIGAGDSYMAAVLSQLLEWDILEPLPADRLTQIGAFASRCAGITVSRAGANPPTRDEVG